MGDDIEPGSAPDGDGAHPEGDPFKGTPMEGLFAAFGGSGGAMGGGHMPDLTVLFGQMQQMFQPHDGPINFSMATATDCASSPPTIARFSPPAENDQPAALSSVIQVSPLGLTWAK